MNNRPLSPHISIYRWPITMTVSIMHRGTGIAMAAGFLLLAAWLFAAAVGADSYSSLTSFLNTVFGKLLLVGWSFAFFFHFANGIRHLFWDSGYGFDKDRASATAWFVIVFAVVLTALLWLVLL